MHQLYRLIGGKCDTFTLIKKSYIIYVHQYILPWLTNIKHFILSNSITFILILIINIKFKNNQF